MRVTIVVCTAVCCFLCSMVNAGAPVELGGDLPKVITADKSPYLAITDLYVPAGKTVNVEAGTVIMFKNFTAIHVRGTLIARGTAQRQIVFTSENDGRFNKETALNPTPYDWNGLYIHKEGFGTSLENVNVLYSVKGVFSETKYIRIADCVFKDNGRSNCTIEGDEKIINQAAPFTYDVSVRDAKIDGVPIRILKDPDAARRNVFRYTGLGMCAAGLVFGGVFGYQWYSANNEYKDLSDRNNIAVQEDPGNLKVIDDKIDERKKDGILSASGGAFLMAGGILLVWSFTF